MAGVFSVSAESASGVVVGPPTIAPLPLDRGIARRPAAEIEAHPAITAVRGRATRAIEWHAGAPVPADATAQDTERILNTDTATALPRKGADLTVGKTGSALGALATLGAADGHATGLNAALATLAVVLTELAATTASRGKGFTAQSITDRLAPEKARAAVNAVGGLGTAVGTTVGVASTQVADHTTAAEKLASILVLRAIEQSTRLRAAGGIRRAQLTDHKAALGVSGQRGANRGAARLHDAVAGAAVEVTGARLTIRPTEREQLALVAGAGVRAAGAVLLTGFAGGETASDRGGLAGVPGAANVAAAIARLDARLGDRAARSAGGASTRVAAEQATALTRVRAARTVVETTAGIEAAPIFAAEVATTLRML